MSNDETLLDVLGIGLLAFAFLAAGYGFKVGLPPLQVIEAVQPIIFLGVAAVAGVGAILAFLRNR